MNPTARSIPFEDTSLFGGANGILGVVVVSLLVYYVVQANMLAADTWRLRTMQDELTRVRDVRAQLVAQQSQLEDRTVLTQSAVAAGMVPAGTIASLTQTANVATAR